VIYDCLVVVVVVVAAAAVVMAALCNRTGHYIFALWCFFFFLSFYLFPRLIQSSEIGCLPHMVWP